MMTHDNQIEKKINEIKKELIEDFEKYGGGRIPYLRDFNRSLSMLKLDEKLINEYSEVFFNELVEIDKNRGNTNQTKEQKEIE